MHLILRDLLASRLVFLVFVAGVVESVDRKIVIASDPLTIKIPVQGSLTIALSPSGKLIAAAGDARKTNEGNSIFVWDTISGTLRSTLRGPSPQAKMLFSADEKTLTTFEISRESGMPGTLVRHWDLANSNRLETYVLAKGGLLNALSPSGRHLITRTSAIPNAGLIWDLSGKTVVSDFQVNAKRLCCAAIDKKERIIVAGDSSGELTVRDLQKGMLICKFKGKPLAHGIDPISKKSIVIDIDPSVINIDLSPDGKTVVAWDKNEVVRLWNVADGTLLGTVPKVKCPPCRFTPDGQFVITMSHNVMEFRSTKDAELVKTLNKSPEQKMFAHELLLSDDGQIAAVSLGSGWINIWNIREVK